ncbi:ABC transporter ATP-binding protein [Rummeliibacillus stabekisii]|uniref:ABC transporter ATP-binding protein n=1 Tax=Rummeliibacillus stabekisii TaxID=241244 RepID=UPI0011740627|nr:ABC transporter ATP-binding protein [Rummeliibacillus stabekisii]MBB5170629.1 ATP-binding cassette subfamily B protein [Rummeliibacillus stabekisii]GEL04885.1 putative ABC transporter ATP-binding protein YfiC [Rummeliibacillus stabekisii]
MIKNWFRSYMYEPVLTKEEIQSSKKKKGSKAANWRRTLGGIWKLVDEQRGLLIFVLLMVIVSSILSLLGPYLIGKIIDDYLVEKRYGGLKSIIGILVAVYVGLSLSLFLQNYWMIGIAQQTVYRMRTGLFSKLQRLPISFFDQRQHGDLMSRMTNDIDNISSTLNSTFIQVFSSTLILIGTVVVMVSMSPLLTLLTMVIIPIMFVSTRFITRRTGRLFKRQQEALGMLNGMIEETISGQRIVKAFSQEERVIEDFTERSSELRRIGYWANVYSGAIPKVMNFLNNASFAIVAGAGGILAYNGYVSIGTIVVFAEYARQFTRPLNDLANQFNNILSAIAGAERVFVILDEEDEQDEAKHQPYKKIQGDVRFKDVSFKYNAEEAAYTLSHINFHVKEGQTAALVGATGAGKTTIMQLLARFYEAQEGSILIDGAPISSYARETIRSQMAFVLQEPFLFQATIMENIRYGNLDATDEEVIEAAKRANAHHFIMSLPDGYNTELAMDGGEISQGQKQLLSIARALVAGPSILLLDEATSSIDTVTELEIQEALERLMEGRTSFVIAHRLNTVKKADVIFVMEQGQLVESGSRQELIQKKGIFYQMLQNNNE